MRRAFPFLLALGAVLAFLMMGQAPSPPGGMDLYSRGGVSQADADLRYLMLDTSNDPLTGSLEMSGANGTCDISSSAAQQMEVCSTSGSLFLRTQNGSVTLNDSSANQQMTLFFNPASDYQGGVYMNDGGSMMRFNGGGAYEKYQGTTMGIVGVGGGWQNPDRRAAGVAIDMTSSAHTQTDLVAWYAGGLEAQRTIQTCDCGTTGTPNTVTCDIQASVIVLRDGDADSCTVTLATTTIDSIIATGGNVDVPRVLLYVDTTGGGGTFDIADQAGVVDVRGTWQGTTDNTILLRYSAQTADAFIETGRIGGTLTIDGQLFAAGGAGGCAAPQIAFAADGTTGIAHTGAGTWDLCGGGSVAVRRDATNVTFYQAILVPAGSAAAPAWSFYGDSNTGAYNAAADTFALSTGGTLAAYWDNTYAVTARHLVPDADGTRDLGVNGFSWDQLRVGSIMHGNPGGGDEVELSDSTVMRQQTTSSAPDYFRLPAHVDADVTTNRPACATSADAGKLLYLDDDDDAVVAGVCVCGANAVNAYGWRSISNFGVNCHL